MSIINRHADQTYAAEALTGFDTDLTSLNSRLSLPTADTEFVKRMARIGMKGGDFAREALDLARANALLIPAGLSITQMEKNIQNRELLATRVVQVGLLYEKLRTALVLHGVDAYGDALSVYNSLQKNGKDQGLKPALQHLGRMFKRGPKKTEATPTTPEVPGNSSTPAQP